MLDDDQQLEIYDYFMESATDQIEAAPKEFEGDMIRRTCLCELNLSAKWLIK
jgi:hypothetical protein